MKARRPVALLVACWFAFLSVWTPRQAFAFAPVAVLAAPQIVSAGGTAYLLSVAALSSLVGVVGLYFTIEDAQEYALRIPLGPNPSNEPPQPLADPTSVTVPNYIGGGNTFSSFSEACISAFNYQSSINPPPTNYEYVLSTNAQPSCGYKLKYVPNGSLSGEYSLTIGTSSGCPSGYTLNGGSCQLVNARQATDDKTCDILLSSGQFATANDINCSATADGTKLAPMIRDGKVIAYGKPRWPPKFPH